MGSGLERLKEKDRNLSQLRYSTRRVPDFNGTENIKIAVWKLTTVTLRTAKANAGGGNTIFRVFLAKFLL